MVAQEPDMKSGKVKRGLQAGKKGGDPLLTCCLWGPYGLQRPLLSTLRHSSSQGTVLGALSQVRNATQTYDAALGGMIPPRGGKLIYTNHIYNSASGDQGKEGECGGWIYGIKHPKSNSDNCHPNTNDGRRLQFFQVTNSELHCRGRC